MKRTPIAPPDIGELMAAGTKLREARDVLVRWQETTRVDHSSISSIIEAIDENGGAVWQITGDIEFRRTRPLPAKEVA